MITLESIEELKKYIGKITGKSPWVNVSQNRINEFAKATEDYQWIHLDEEKSKEGPFGSTIAHGFLSLSLLASMSGGLKLENTVMGINYGLDKVRFLNPVKVGAKIRGRFTLVSAEEKKPLHFLLKHNVVVEIEGEEKPALIADWLGMTVVN